MTEERRKFQGDLVLWPHTLNAKYLGPVDLRYPSGMGRVLINSYHYCCPRCGEVWAEMIPEEGVISSHHFMRALCPEHGGGSFRLWGDFPLKNLPLHALLHEVDLIIQHGEEYEYLNHRGY